MSQEFYSTIPHKLGKSKEEISKKIINSVEAFEDKLNLLQNMKDIIEVKKGKKAKKWGKKGKKREIRK